MTIIVKDIKIILYSKLKNIKKNYCKISVIVSGHHCQAKI
jgi:hypothetical protein